MTCPYSRWLPLSWTYCACFFFPQRLQGSDPLRGANKNWILLWNKDEQKLHKWSLSSSWFYLKTQISCVWRPASECRNKRGVVGPGELWPPPQGSIPPSLRHCNNRGVEMRGAVRAKWWQSKMDGDEDNKRGQAGQREGGKRETREERERRADGESRSGTNGWVCVRINEWSAGLSANVRRQFVWQMDFSARHLILRKQRWKTLKWSLCRVCASCQNEPFLICVILNFKCTDSTLWFARKDEISLR